MVEWRKLQPIRAEQRLPSPSSTPSLQNAGPSVCCSMWKRGRLNSAWGVSLCACLLPSTTTSTGFKAPSFHRCQWWMNPNWHWGKRHRERSKNNKQTVYRSSLSWENTKKSVYKTVDQIRISCLGSMYNSVCFIVLSWVISLLVYPGKTYSIPLSLFFVSLCLASVFYVARQLLLARIAALFRQILSFFHSTNHPSTVLWLVVASERIEVLF